MLVLHALWIGERCLSKLMTVFRADRSRIDGLRNQFASFNDELPAVQAQLLFDGGCGLILLPFTL